MLTMSCDMLGLPYEEAPILDYNRIRNVSLFRPGQGFRPTFSMSNNMLWLFYTFVSECIYSFSTGEKFLRCNSEISVNVWLCVPIVNTRIVSGSVAVVWCGCGSVRLGRETVSAVHRTKCASLKIIIKYFH